MVTARELLNNSQSTTITPEYQGLTASELLANAVYDKMSGGERVSHQLIPPPDGYEPQIEPPAIQMGEYPVRNAAVMQPEPTPPVDLNTASLDWDIPADPVSTVRPQPPEPPKPPPGLYSPEALGIDYGRYYNDYMGPPVRPLPEEMAAGVGRGLMQVGITGKSLYAMVYDVTGDKEKADRFVESVRKLKETVAGHKWGAAVGRVEDVKSFKDAMRLAAGFLGEQAPVMTVLMGSGILGGGLGAMGASTSMQTGSIYSDLAERGHRGKGAAATAVVFGTLTGALDALPVMRILDRTGYGNKAKSSIIREMVKDGYLKTFVKEGVKHGVFEGGTEGLQTTGERYAIKWIDHNYKVFDKEGRSEILNAVLGGGFLGFFMGAGTSPAQVRQSKAMFPYLEEMDYAESQDTQSQQAKEQATEDILTKKMVNDLGISEPDAREAVKDAINKSKQREAGFIPLSDKVMDRDMAEGLAPTRDAGPVVIPAQTPLQKKQAAARETKESGILDGIQKKISRGEATPEEIDLYQRIKEKRISQDLWSQSMAGHEMGQMPQNEFLQLDNTVATAEASSTEISDAKILDAVNAAQEQSNQRGNPLYVVQDSSGRLITVGNKPRGNNFIEVTPQKPTQPARKAPQPKQPAPTAAELLQQSQMGKPFVGPPAPEPFVGPPYIPTITKDGQIIGKNGQVIGQTLESEQVQKPEDMPSAQSGGVTEKVSPPVKESLTVEQAKPSVATEAGKGIIKNAFGSDTFYRGGEQFGALDKTGSVFFTDSESAAKQYADNEFPVHKVKLTMDKPLDLRPSIIGRDNAFKKISEILDRKVESALRLTGDDRNTLIKYAKDNEFDGLMMPDTDVSGGNIMESYVVFDKSQIISPQPADIPLKTTEETPVVAAKGTGEGEAATAKPNRIFSDEQYQQDRKDIMGGGLNVGIDPIKFAKAVRVGAYHLENLAIAAKDKIVSFAEWSQKMIADLGDSIKPHLKKIWTEVNAQSNNKTKTAAIAEKLLTQLQGKQDTKAKKGRGRKPRTPARGPATAEEAARLAMPIYEGLQSGELNREDVGANDLVNPGRTEATQDMNRAATEVRVGAKRSTKAEIWTKAKEMLADPAERTRLLEKIRNEEAADSPQEECAMQELTEYTGAEGFLKNDPALIMDGIRMASNRETQGTLHGQILAMRSATMRQFDSRAKMILSYLQYVPRGIREKIAKEKQLAKEAHDAGLPGEALKHLNNINDINQARLDQLKALRKEFDNWGIDLSSVEALDQQIKDDPRVMFKMMQAIKQRLSEAGPWDALMELIRCNLMSAPITPLRNILSGSYAVGDLAMRSALLPLRIAIAKITGQNTVSNSTWQELPAVWQAITSKETWARAIQYAQWTAQYELPAFELMTGNLRNSQNVWMYSNAAIDGKLLEAGLGWTFGPIGGKAGRLTGKVGGRIVRGVGMMPTAVGDQFVKTVYAHAEVAMAAARFAKEKNLALDGDAYKTFIEDQIHNLDSVSWERALAEGNMYKVAFQSEGDVLEKGLLKARNAKILGMKPLQLIMPFVKTPLQITGRAIGITYGMPKMGVKALRSAIGEKHYSVQQAVDDLGETIIGLAVLAMIWSMLDRDTITPTEDYRPDKRKEGFTYGPIAPPSSVKIGDRWYSYDNYGPYSTALGLTVNGAFIAKDFFQRKFFDMSEMTVDEQDAFMKDTNDLWKDWTSRSTGVIYDQSFLKGVGNLTKAGLDAEKYGDKFLMDMARMGIPNLWSATFRATDKKIRNMRSDQTKSFSENLKSNLGYSTGFSETIPPPVTDIMGEDIERLGDSDLGVFIRAFCSPSIIREDPKKRDYDALRMVKNWNDKHISDRKFFSEMTRNFPAEERKDRIAVPAITLNKQEIYDMHQLGGKLFAEAFLKNYSHFNIEKPTIANIRELEMLRDTTSSEASGRMRSIKLLENQGKAEQAKTEYMKLRARSQLAQENVTKLREQLKNPKKPK